MVSCAILALAMMVSVAPLAEASNQVSVYIVHLAKDNSNAKSPESAHLEILSSICGGSREKAKEAILYSYTNSMYGFSAKLTPEQAVELSKKPGVLAVNPQGVAQLHGGQRTPKPVSRRN